MSLRLTEDIYQTAKVAKVLLLLNVGRGLEFKGKSLTEIEVAGDLVDYDKEDEENTDSVQNEGAHNTEEQNKNVPTDIDQQYNLNKNEIDHSKSLKIDQNKITNKPTGSSSNVKNSNRIRWSQKDKKLVLKYFQKHVKTKTTPKKQECLNFIDINSGLFNQSDWLRIKTLVYNTFRDK